MAKYNTNVAGPFINAQGRVVKNRSGFEPMEGDAIRDRIKRGKARIRAYNSAIANMENILAGPAVAEVAPINAAAVQQAVNDAVARVLQAA